MQFDGLDQRLQAILPICGLCSGPLHEAVNRPNLLLCGHVFCFYCLPDLTQCPFDGSSVSLQAPDHLCARIDTALKMQYHSNREMFRQTLDSLEFAYSQVKVPCKLACINKQCPFPQHCRYDHSLQFFKVFPCPRGAACWRGEMCLFSHTPLVNYSTEQILIKSISLLRRLEAWHPVFLEIVTRYQVQVEQIQSSEIAYITGRKWMYEYQTCTVEFDPQAQVDIQYAVDHFKTFVHTSGVKVFFRPQFLIAGDESVYRVACTTVCTGTSAAGVLTYVCDERWKDAFRQEIQQLECEVPGTVVGNKQLAWMKNWGLGLWNDQIIGETETLLLAMSEKPIFDEFDDIMEMPFQFDPNSHSISGRTVEVFAGKIVGLKDDVIKVCTQTNAQLRQAPYYPAYPVNSLPAVGWAPQLYQSPLLSQPTYAPVPVPVSVPSLRGSGLTSDSNGHPSLSVERARNLVKVSLPQARIIEITPAKVNSAAKNRFEDMKRELSADGSAVNTEFLFHGTKNEDPRVIICAANCLNSRMRFGLWGRGIYFYEHLRAVNNYSYVTAQGHKQTLLCEVLTGTALVSQPSPFTEPPEGYDSVEGFDHNSRLWVVYDEDVAIPAYLITYVD